MEIGMLGCMKRRILQFNKDVTTRSKILRYLRQNRLQGLTLNVGDMKGSGYSKFCSEAISMDVAARFPVDLRADVQLLPFRDESFDSTLCVEVLEHVHHPERAIGEMRRVLRPGGRILLTTRFAFPIHDRPADFFRFTKYGLRHLLRDWTITKIQETDTSFETIIIVQNRFVADKQLSLFVRLMVLCATLLVLPLARLASRAADTDCISSGYIVDATKPQEPAGP